MFCYQCEQTVKGQGCTLKGVCGKEGNISDLQDAIIYGLMCLSKYALEARKLGAIDKEINIFTIEGLFTTVTNVNFDESRHLALINKLQLTIEKAKKLYESAAKIAKITPLKIENEFIFPKNLNLNELLKYSKEIGIEANKSKYGETITGLKWLIIYGLKGMAAYADHAHILGEEDDKVFEFFHNTLSFLNGKRTVDELLQKSLEVGGMNLHVMELLDKANTQTYGHPVPTEVRVTPVKGKCILVSGHDLKDLEELLKQTENKGINIYTHGEMLPTHGYPKLKKYKHLVGNFGGAWQDQQKEFPNFPGPILMTTNCIQKPLDSYKHRIYSINLVGWPEINHITNRNFKPLIECALKEKGFFQDEPEKYITVGFGRNAVMSVAPKVINAVKAGKIKHFYLIGGCDGAKPGRNYYTEFAEKAPKDTVILTLACGKYRFNKLEFGDIDGIPRLLDIGQCNDSYSAIQIAMALSKAFNTDVNSLPLSLIISWYEQKAVAVLLTLLHLGIKNIRLGPTLPAFVTKEVLGVLVDKFAIKPIGKVEDDIKNSLINN